MKIQHKKIIFELYKADDWLTASQIATFVGASIRSVKNYVSEINFLYKNCIISSRNGYKLKDNNIVNEINIIERIPQENDERVNYIIKKILLQNDNAKLEIDDLAEDIYVSNTTVMRIIDSAKKLCHNFNLELSVQKNIVHLVGPERNKRKLMKHIYISEFGSNKISIQTMEKLFPTYNLAVLRGIIHEICKKHKYYINGYSYDYLLLDTLITLDRIKNNHPNQKNTKDINEFDIAESKVAKEIIYQLEKRFNVSFDSNEISAYTSILVSYLMKIDYKNLTVDGVKRIIGDECVSLVETLLKIANEYYFINANNPDFYVKFAIHIYNLLYRAETNFISNNPITTVIKKNSPLLFDCAVRMSEMIYSLKNYRINEDEIAYIAIHIGSALEAEENSNRKLTAVLIFPQYYNFHLLLEDRIAKDFNEHLVINDVYTSISEMKSNRKKYDLIISTIPIEYEDGEFVEIGSFYTPNDYQKIYDKISNIKKKQKKEILLEQLISISSPTLFAKDLPIHNKKEILEYINEEMYKNGYCSKDYIYDVLNREEASSTKFGNIAVPHGIELDCKRTGLFALLSNKGIEWDDGIVNIVIFLAINKNDNSVFRNVYDNLIVMLLDNKVVNEVLKSEDYYEFIERIVNEF